VVGILENALKRGSEHFIGGLINKNLCLFLYLLIMHPYFGNMQMDLLPVGTCCDYDIC
jgi:hypothetical protein